MVDVATWGLVGSIFAALITAVYFFRKLVVLTMLWWTLSGKVRGAKTADEKVPIRKVVRATFTHIMATFLRFLATCGAAASLSWTVAINRFLDQGDSDELPFWITLGSLGCALLAALLCVIIEYRARYDLPVRLGECVCEAFRLEIENMHKNLSKPLNDIDTKQSQERETWEYVAQAFIQKYRFDSVFGPSHVGSLHQYIQSGMGRHRNGPSYSRVPVEGGFVA